MNEAFFSLKDLIEMKEYAPTRIFSLAPNPEQIEVRHVTSIERATKGFIRRGEYVLTTAVYWTTEEKFLQFVKEIYLGGAVAIAFSFMENADGVPESVKEFARERQFTLIQLRAIPLCRHHRGRAQAHRAQQRQIIESWNELQNSFLPPTCTTRRPRGGAHHREHLHEPCLTDPQRSRSPSAGSPGGAAFPRGSRFNYFSALTEEPCARTTCTSANNSHRASRSRRSNPSRAAYSCRSCMWFDREDIIRPRARASSTI